MEVLKRARRPVRREFEKLQTELEKLVKEVPLQKELISVTFKLFCESFEQLQLHDSKIVEQMTKDNTADGEEDKEFDEIRDYKIKFETVRVKKETVLPAPSIQPTESINGEGGIFEAKIRNIKLPTIQMKRFTGELIDWLPFWAQFQKIDEHPGMTGSDKLTYLIQLLEPGTDAHEIASGYPQTNENYQLVVAALKKRYANEDLLLQVYIRQLLNLVISNVNSKDKIPVKSLYLKLDSHIRALKSLNLEKADPATWLFPLVESSLPEKILDNWQRSALSTTDGSKEDPPRTRLDLLMEFVGKEVDIRQRIDLTKSFNIEQKGGNARGDHHEKNGKGSYHGKRTATPTLSSFHSAQHKQCVFCGKTNHNTRDCFRAREMSNEAKIDILKKKQLCFRCCGPHLGRECKEKLDCKICHRQHLTVLCKEFKRKFEEKEQDQTSAKRSRTEDASTKTTTNCSNMECSGEVALQTLLVKIINGEKERTVRAFIDGGCQRSYVLKKTARALGLEPVGVERVVHSLFGNQRTPPTTHNKYEITLGAVENNFQFNFIVRDSNRLCGALPKVTERYDKLREELQAKNVTLTDNYTKSSEIELLIGGDLYAHLITGKIQKLTCGATAIHTDLGWTLLGSITEDDDDEKNMTSLSMAYADESVTKLWELETLGIKDVAEEAAIKKKRELAIENYVSSIIRAEDGRYYVKLPWKENLPYLPSNRDVAFKRLQSATKKLLEAGMFNAYDKILKDWESEGFIEQVTEEMKDDGRTHYLPHRAVIKPESLTTPVRPVFDASCRVGKSPSLNDCLFTGENYVQLIPELLQRFREKKVAFVADIRKAFQMIGVESSDRNVMRFLWWMDKEMKKTVEFRHARVMFGATCSPFILAAVLHHHLTSVPEEDKEMGVKLLSTLYVDNCVHSEDNTEDYAKFREKAVQLMNGADMDLRMWLSNVEEIQDESTRIVSVLGVQWDRLTDELFINVKKISIPPKVTKRIILSNIQKIFDPIGFACPCILPMKILLQRTWLNKLKWDEKIPEAEARRFYKWCSEVMELDNIRIPRLSTYGVTDKSKWELHTFVDGSKDAFSGAVFLRVKHEENYQVQLLAAKSRLAPLKRMTIPKLELMGCLVGARLAASVKRSFQLSEATEFYWTDSTTALAWIRRNDEWGTFVGNRTKEINELTKRESWRHVPGEENPADLPSRGCSPAQLQQSRWWEGPKWLYEDESYWPTSATSYNEQEIMEERKKSAAATCTVSCSVLSRVQNSHSFLGLVRIMGWVRRFLHNKFIKDKKLRKCGDLSKNELKKAEMILIREIQREAFPPGERAKLTGLEIFQDDWGILRVRTRLTYRKDLGDFRFPMLLPSKKEEVFQLIRDTHRMYCHAGVGFLTTKLRSKYWILKARRTIKGVTSKCYRCRRFTAKPIIPEPAPLPLDRVKDAEVFEVVGVDLAGPLILKSGAKAWLVIFTCGVYRAVHFELVRKLSSSAFIGALEKFCEKYRRPATIYSDNGTNFRGAVNLFKKIDWASIEKSERTSKIEWKFNPVTSSWWGGWWERLIRTAKDLLKRTVGKGSLSLSELQAVLKTVEETMNSRPLTYVSENPDELEPLTPAVFLHPFGQARFPEGEMTTGQKLRFRLSYVTKLRKELKGRFLKEYLSLLVNKSPKRPTRELREGELVYVGSDNAKRTEWPLGRIIEVIPGTDKVKRVAKVKTEKGIIVRSVQRLYPLEAEIGDEKNENAPEKAILRRSGRRVKAPVKYK